MLSKRQNLIIRENDWLQIGGDTVVNVFSTAYLQYQHLVQPVVDLVLVQPHVVLRRQLSEPRPIHWMPFQCCMNREARIVENRQIRHDDPLSLVK